MATTHTYTAAELTASNDVDVIRRLALDAGYTEPITVKKFDDSAAEPFEVTVADESVVKATLLSDINAATHHTLSVSVSLLQIVGDGVATGTITVSDSRGATASGKTVKLRLPPTPIQVDAASVVLDASGDGVFTFGPTHDPDPAGSRVCSDRPFLATFYYDNDEAESVTARVEFTA